MRRIYIAQFGPFPDKPTGLAMSVLRRAMEFNRIGTPVTVLVDHFVPDMQMHYAGHSSAGHLNDGMLEIRSLHHDLSGRHFNPSPPQYESPLRDTPGTISIIDEDRPEACRRYRFGVYEEFVWRRPSGQVHFIDALTRGGSIRTERTWFDDSGKPFKRELMDSKNRPYRVEYLRPDASPYLINTLKGGAAYHLVSDKGEQSAPITYDGLYQKWLTDYVLPSDEEPAFISEYGFRRNAIGQFIAARGGSAIYTFHSSHLAPPNTYGSEIRGDQREFLADIATIPSLVVLTSEQKRDLEKQFGQLPNVHVIPHHVPRVTCQGTRDARLIVMVSRFDKIKGVEDMLQAMPRVLSRIPDARLELYGRGPDETAIGQLIESLGLQSSVQLMGFTSKAHEVFARASIVAVPSAHEGFNLSMAEGMAQGCVPVAYGFKYGPRDIITDGSDGMIVEPGNIAELADTISYLFEHPEFLHQASAAARGITEKFTSELMVSRWRTLYRSLGITDVL